MRGTIVMSVGSDRARRGSHDPADHRARRGSHEPLLTALGAGLTTPPITALGAGLTTPPACLTERSPAHIAGSGIKGIYALKPHSEGGRAVGQTLGQGRETRAQRGAASN
jgi:hypothetical protein